MTFHKGFRGFPQCFPGISIALLHESLKDTSDFRRVCNLFSEVHGAGFQLVATSDLWKKPECSLKSPRLKNLSFRVGS